jgi:mRNA interferase MazF
MEKGELWILDFPSKSGREQKGTRPGVILSDTKADLFIAIPLTSNLKSLNLPFATEINKSDINKLEKNSVALVLQIQAMDRKRLLHKIGVLENSYIKEIDEALKGLLKL